MNLSDPQEAADFIRRQQEQSSLTPTTGIPTQDDAFGLDGLASVMPRKEVFLSAFEQHQLEELVNNYRLTPATLAFRLENKKIGPNDPLKWFPAAFLLDISLRVAIGVAKGNYRGIISAPPRHGKSRLTTINGPLWVLENFANKNVVTTTYGADLSEDFARIIRDFIENCPDDLDVRIRTDANRISKFLTNKDGALTSIGLGGPITGRGADVLFIDDYIKQIKEANSQSYRDFVWDWFTTTAMTRLEPNASVIIIATRWHHDDLIGRILRQLGTIQEGTGDWDYIKYHATARENDPLGRKVGEALFPQRYNEKVLAERKKLLGSFYYDAIFDQEPHETTSDLTKKEWIIKKKAEELPKVPMRFVRVWDFAGTEEKKADFTAGGLYAGWSLNAKINQMCCLNMLRRQLTSGKIEELVLATAEEDGPETEVIICQETGSAGKAVVEHYKNNVLPGFKVTGYYWNTAKEVVAQPWLAQCEAGNFFILDAPWNQEFIDEFGSFPSDSKTIKDDQVDTGANAHIHLFGKKRRKTMWASGRSGKLTAVDQQKAADELRKASENSPHRGRLGGSKFIIRSVSRATFGRKGTR